MTNREAAIADILASIDADALAGWCSNWAATEETPTALIVTFADGKKQRYPLPRC